MIIHRRWLVTHASVIAMVGPMFAGCSIHPTEISSDDLSKIASSSIQGVAKGEEPIRGIVDLDQALARALKYNLDHQVELAEHSLRERELELAHYSMLPSVVANSGYADRDNINASSSRNALTGVQSLATSTSQDQRLRTNEATFSWNILDFGLSYVRARQAADKVLIQNELRRKITLRITEDTRAAYWRAVSAQRLLNQLERVERLARDVEGEARTAANDRLASPITALTYEREIIEIQRSIGELQRELNSAHVQLGALMNVPPGTKFTVTGRSQTFIPLPVGNMAELLHTAVMNRPELREVAYRQRINEQEAHAALLEMLPGLNLYAGANFDSNTFLLNNHWQSWGARASWNLLKVFSYSARRAVVEDQDELLGKKALAVTMSIMTQVYVSRIRHAHALKEYRTARRYRDVQLRLLAQIRTEAAADRVSRQTLAREELNALVAEAKLDISFAGVQSAYAFAQSSMGLELGNAVVTLPQPVSARVAAIQ